MISLRQQAFTPPLAIRIVDPWWTTFAVGDRVEVLRPPSSQQRPTVEPIITPLPDRVNR
ncbi:MAG: hypothetical protein L0G99_14245 [Propionibacteriales bacterium]|nr:hypothetical protein [Propionibacteriales bacterium]